MNTIVRVARPHGVPLTTNVPDCTRPEGHAWRQGKHQYVGDKSYILKQNCTICHAGRSARITYSF